MATGGLQGIGHIPYERDAYWLKCCQHLGYECLTKKEVYEALGYTPLPTLLKLHRSREIHRVLSGGNRSGKTYGGMMEIIPYLFWLNTCGWVVSATYELAENLRQKIEDLLIERAGMERVLRPDNLQPWQFSYSTHTHTFMMGTGSWFQLKSADSPNSMHAWPLDWILIDEAALLPYILYDTRLTPRLVDSGGWVLSMGTFEMMTGEWFEEYYDIGQVPNDMNIVSWQHPTEDNYHVYTAKGGETPLDLGEKFHLNWRNIVKSCPQTKWPLVPGAQVIVWNIDRDWLEKQKARVPKAIYAARYEAKRASNPYLVFPTWNLVDYVDATKAAFAPDLPVYLAVDPGGTYAVAAIQLKKLDNIGVDNELTKGYALCIIDELYFQTTVTTYEVGRAAQAREWWPNVGRWPWPHWDPVQGSIDVTSKEQERTWEHLAKQDDRIRKLHLMSRLVNRQPGIQTLQHFLDTKSIFVHPRCMFWNIEMRRWTYPVPSLAGADTEDPRKKEPKDAWNHLTKAVIYFIVNKFGYYGRGASSALSTRKSIRDRKRDEVVEIAKSVVSRFRK